ncbi:proteasome assembly chaperone 3 [Jimgerdemannia flammicorona]|uniref:Proteasome assembly chaperone 3 n=1 Tax=Jimgerdemannia flammicorona TaxID=994334 RepID=A0A433DNW1_9FUNG|nr:proteasome assembly chaperone 3 [Jimgerdemannia flammicorona]
MADVASFPVQNRQLARSIDGVHTDVLVSAFADRILVVATQYRKIGSLFSSTPSTVPTTTHFLLGSSTTTQSGGHLLYASHISQTIAAMNPSEKRPVLLGIALKDLGDDNLARKRVFEQLMEMIKECRVW